jgi:LuxR family maltose regulon positive regulatory protein
VLYEWNDLDGALHHATAGVRLSKRGRLVDTVRGGYIILAQVHRARGHTAKALEIAREEERLALTYEHHAVSALAAPLRATLQLWDQSRAAMSGWLRQLVVGLDSQSGYGHELEQLCLAGALVANASSASQARETEAGEALRLLAPLLDAAKASGRNGSVIKIIALQALAFQALGEQEVACFRLKEALSMAEREGYVRTFVDEGEPMARLLRRALCQGIAPNYVARLLAACSEEVALTVPATEPLIEPLTERELDVLRLVVAGLSNAEIAEELVIAVSTVKSHINHIYGKLGVKNRAEAVAQVLAGGLL